GVDWTCIADSRPHLFGYRKSARLCQLSGLAEFAQEQDEFVSSKPGHRVALTHQVLQPLSDSAQHCVTDIVTLLVIDILEFIQINEQHCSNGTRVAVFQRGDFQLFEKHAPV